MKRSPAIATAVILVFGVGLTAFALKMIKPAAETTEEHGRDGEGLERSGEKGPHGGRLLRKGDFAVEITIFETGTPPRFRVYCFDGAKSIDPERVNLTVELRRLGGRTNVIQFTQEGGYLVSQQTVDEPHSFDVTVVATRGGETVRWEYPSYESRVELTPEAIGNAGIEVETAGPAKIREALKVNGRIVPNEEKLKHVVPRYPGVLKEVRKRLGDLVRKDEVLAVVESNESLQRYEVTSDLTGTVLEKHAVPGEFVREGEGIYVVADLSTVWVDLNVYRQDADRIKEGQTVIIDGGEGLHQGEGTISYISPFGSESTQTLLARVVVPNSRGQWRPGLFVTAEILLEKMNVPVAVKGSALQTFRDWTVVFLNEGNLFEPLIIEPGRRDRDWVEVRLGMKPGQRYVARNSFVIKADILKAGATHDH